MRACLPLFQLLKRMSRQFTHDRRAATSLEFAILAVPFMMWLVSIMLGGLQMFLLSTLDSATQIAARQMEVGTLPRTASDVQNSICTMLKGMGTCDATSLQSYATTASSFQALTGATLSGSTLSPKTFGAGTYNSYVLLQVAYTSPFNFPGSLLPKLTLLSSVAYQNNSNVP